MSSTTKSRKRTVRLLAGLAVAVLLAAGALALSKQRNGAPPPATPAPLEFAGADLALAETRELARTLPLTGTLRPLNEAVLKAKVAGEIQVLAVREGDRVRAGQVIGRIDATEAQARLAEREAEVESARAQLGVAGKNRATQQALLERKFISQNAFDATLGNFDVAQARLKAAQASADVARKTLRDTVLTAPMDGIVSIRHAQPGERVAVDGRIVTIVDLHRLELAAQLPAGEIGAVQTGQPVQFRVEGFGERWFAGRVERINPSAAAGSRSIELYAVIDNPDGTLRGGMFAQGRLTVGRVANALVVPASAVREERGELYVFAIVDNKVVRLVVKLAGQADDLAQIATGLAPGTRVVRHNLGSLREGAEARVLQAAPPAGR